MSDTAIPSEVEAKLLAQPSDLRAIAQLNRIAAYRLQSRDRGRVHSQYLDTKEFALAHHGIALRLRRKASQWEVTAKWSGKVRGEIHERPELNIALSRKPTLPFELPAGPLREKLQVLVAGRPLEAVLISDMVRHSFDVLAIDSGPNAAPLAELALDSVRLHAVNGGPSTSYCEVEIECVAGKRHDVVLLARSLQRSFNLSSSSESKFSHGMKMLYGADVVKAPDTELRAGDSLGSAVRKIVTRHLDHLRQSHPGTLSGKNPEALHEMRVAIRRLRVLLRAFPEGFPARSLRFFEAELRWLGQELGSVRDLDVQLERLMKDRAAAPPRYRAGLAGLEKFLLDERRRRRRKLLTTLDSSRYLSLLVRLEQFGEPPPHFPRRGPAAAAAAKAGAESVKRAMKGLLKRGDKTRAAPTPEDLHALRIGAKRARYIAEFLADLTGKRGKRLVRRLVRLQDQLGTYHDAVVAADFVQQYVDTHGSAEKPGNLLALGALVSNHLRHAQRASDNFAEAWKDFCRKRTKRDVERVLDDLHEITERVSAATKSQQTSSTAPRRRDQTTAKSNAA